MGIQTRNGDLVIADQVGSTRHTRHLRTEELKSESRLRANDLTLLNNLWAPEGRRSKLTISIPKRASLVPQACGAAGPGRINGWEVEDGQESRRVPEYSELLFGSPYDSQLKLHRTILSHALHNRHCTLWTNV
jgi:hypothetical protein